MAISNAPSYDEYIHEPNNEKLDGIPGDLGLPLIGHSAEFYKDPFEWARKQYPKYGPVIRTKVLGGQGVTVLGPDLMERIYLDPGREFSSRMGFMDRVGVFFGNSIIMQDFEHHRHMRRILQSAFKNDAMQHYTAEINMIYDRALQEWSTDAGTAILFFKYIKQLLLDVAVGIFIGEKERDERANRINQAFTDCVNGMMYMVPFRFPGNTLDKGLKGRVYLEQVFRDMVAVKRHGDGLDTMSHFCREKDENGNYFSDEEIASQTIFLLFAAHDTTTAAISHTIYYLARHPEIKERLYQECKSFGADGLSYQDLDKLPFMQQVFFEIQRVRTSTPIVPRRTIRNVELAGVKIPAHTMIYTVPRFTHYMEEYWTNPFSFDPDRFSPERSEHKKHSFQFHPFGGGAHKCIGMHFSQMEYKCFLYKFLLKYDFEARHKKEPFMQSLPLPKPGDDMPILLIRRN